MSNLRAIEEGESRWFVREDLGLDKGKKIRMKVHGLTKAEEREARKEAYGSRKAGKLERETFIRSVDRGEAHTREQAIRALDDTENYSIELAGPKAVARFRELLPGVELVEGQDLCLDGKWSPAVKRAFFSEFAFSRAEAREVSNLAFNIAKKDEDEEDEATGDFSRP